jgi:integrase
VNQITELTIIAPSIMPADPDKHTKYRINKFQKWQTETKRKWNEPDLVQYRDFMLADYQPATVRAHLSTVRSNYQRILRDNDTRQALFELAAKYHNQPADRKAFVDEAITRLQNDIDPKSSPVKIVERQDRSDSETLRLSQAQAEMLLIAPLKSQAQPLVKLRDSAVISLLLCTGIREAELAALNVENLRQRMNGELALHIREGKGCKDRLIPYGELSWVLAIVDRWLDRAGITEGAVFRGFYKGGKNLRPGRLSVRAIEYILATYPLMIEDKLLTAKPHDLRRTYARRAYDADMDLVAIKQNLGHADLKTTLGYIGQLDAKQRRAPSIYNFDLTQLNGVNGIK